MHFILYSADNCKLCDEAESLIYSALEGYRYQLDVVNIKESPALMKKYALRIPVLAKRTGSSEELRWPFRENQVHELLNHCGKEK